jgi:hypothetical protein
MFVLRAAFWIVLMAFLIDGGTSAWTTDVPASAKQSASHVVAAVGTFRGFCNDHQSACNVAGGAVDFARQEVAAAATYVGQALSKGGKVAHKEG